jgi:hypothetical protein
VDTLGLLLAVAIQSASVQDWTGIPHCDKRDERSMDKGYQNFAKNRGYTDTLT